MCVDRLNFSGVCPAWKVYTSNVLSLNNYRVTVDFDVNYITLVKRTPSRRALNTAVAQRIS